MLTALRRHAVPLAVALGMTGCAAVSQFNVLSEQEELAMGAEFAAQLEQELVFITDPTVVGYIDRLGQRLAAVSQRSNIPYKFHVVDTEDVNAFAVPGGYLYVHRGLIEAADSESELAGVLGHEIGHIVGRHSARQLSQQMGIAALAQVALGQNPNTVAAITAQIIATGAITRYSREMEGEADRLGVQELVDAGIDPGGLATFFDKLEEMRGGAGGSALEKFFSTHPEPGARAAEVRAMVSSINTSGLKKDSAEFQSVKSRVLAMPRPPQG
ncbi:MAG: M48 family metalloprotease [Gemmatimonadetes bacterium]|nr:M48 family metalloprotease [Gemmatimonadota bacterium]